MDMSGSQAKNNTCLINLYFFYVLLYYKFNKIEQTSQILPVTMLQLCLNKEQSKIYKIMI